MRLKHFLADLARLSPLVNEWTDINAESIELTPWGIEFTGATSDVEDQLADSKQEVKNLEEACKIAETAQQEAEQRMTAMEKELDALKDEMADLKDPESGVDVATYRDDARKAEERAQLYHEASRTWQTERDTMADELTAMRKRKGVEPGVMACAREVMSLVHGLADHGKHHVRYQNTFEHYQQAAQKLRTLMQERAALTVKSKVKEAA